MKKRLILFIVFFLAFFSLTCVSLADSEENLIDINVETSWKEKDEENMPESVTVSLYINGTDSGKIIVVTENTNWSGKFTDLPEYDENNQKINYTIKEEPIFGFDSEVTIQNEEEVTEEEVWVQTQEPTDGNEYALSIIDWTDNNKEKTFDSDDNGNIQLTDLEVNNDPIEVDGKEYAEHLENPDESSLWKITKQDDGTYVINKEDNKDLTLVGKQNITYGWYGPQYSYDYSYKVDDFVKNHNGYGWDGSTSTNHQNNLILTPMEDGTVKISAKQDWGNYNQETGKEKFFLINSNGTLGTTDVSDWAGRFKIYEKRIIEKIKVLEYKFLINATPNERTDVKVTKQWEDDEKLHENEEFTINLLANGEETGKTVKVSSENDWKNSFDNLVKYDTNGKEIKYTVTEEPTETHTSEVKHETENTAKEYYVVIKTDEDLKDGDYIVAFYDWTIGNQEYRMIWMDGTEFKYGELGFVHESELTITDINGDVYDEYLLADDMEDYLIWNLKNENGKKVLMNNDKVLALRAEQYNANPWGWQSMFNYYFLPVDEGVSGWYGNGTELGGQWGSNYNIELEIEVNNFGPPNRYISSNFAYDVNYNNEEHQWYGFYTYDENGARIEAYDSVERGGSFKFLKKVYLEGDIEVPNRFMILGRSIMPIHGIPKEDVQDEDNTEINDNIQPAKPIDEKIEEDKTENESVVKEDIDNETKEEIKEETKEEVTKEAKDEITENGLPKTGSNLILAYITMFIGIILVGLGIKNEKK